METFAQSHDGSNAKIKELEARLQLVIVERDAQKLVVDQLKEEVANKTSETSQLTEDLAIKKAHNDSLKEKVAEMEKPAHGAATTPP